MFEKVKTILHKYHIDGAQSGTEFFKALRIFNPRNVHILDREFSSYAPYIPGMNNNKYLDEWLNYVNISLEMQPNDFDCATFTIESFWKINKNRIPELFKIARVVLQMPSNSCSTKSFEFKRLFNQTTHFFML